MTDTSAEKSASPSPALPEIPNWVCLLILAFLTLAALRRVLIFHPDEILSEERWDLAYFFVHWRNFGFSELKAGHLPLWNPYLSSGSPFFGNFQSALLYPLNFLYLLLPLGPAINWTITLHIFLGGVFMFYWVRHRDLHSLACLLAAVMFMFCGPHFLQIQTGHLPNLCTLIWAPLLLLAIDKMFDKPGLGPGLLGAFATAMALLAGHPQYVFYLGVAAGIYSVLQWWTAVEKGKIALGLAGMVLGGVALSAIQLFTGLQESSETIRSLGVPYAFAASYSFPPENFLTFIAPWFFGDTRTVPSWGRWYLTEVNIFISVSGLVLAVLGMTNKRPDLRRFAITLVLTSLLLALGRYTPLFPLLYHDVPGFDKFRGMDKFIWLAAIFFSMLAAIGMDGLLRHRPVPRGFAVAVGGVGLAFCFAASLPSDVTWWGGVLHRAADSGTSLLPRVMYDEPRFIAETGKVAAESLTTGAMALLAAAGVLGFARTHRKWACLAALVLVLAEFADFTSTATVTFKPADPYPAQVLNLLNNNPGDYRIRARNPNAGMSARRPDLAGEDPGGLLRYYRFLYFAAGLDYDTSTTQPTPRGPLNPRLSRMVRGRFSFTRENRIDPEIPDPLPHLLLVDHYRVMTDYHQILSALTNANFPMEHEIILETEPHPAPQPAPATPGTVKLLSSTTDTLEIEADTPVPELLLITDSYAKGWRALALPGSAQEHYEIMPANYCLQAIPLEAGHHRIHLEYSPFGFRLGRVVSLVALALFAALLGVQAKRPRNRA